MGNRLDIDSIYKDVGTFGSIHLKHRVVLYTKGQDSKPKPYVSRYVSSRSKGGSVGFESYYYRKTNNALILESWDFDGERNTSNKLKNSVYFTQDDTANAIGFFNEALSWFKDSEIKNNLFEYQGNYPYKVADNYSRLHAMMYPTHGIKGAFISIQPAVVTDFKTKLGYPGVVIKGITGVIGCCTVKEFETLHSVFITNLKILHSLSVELMNHYMLSTLLGV